MNKISENMNTYLKECLSGCEPIIGIYLVDYNGNLVAQLTKENYSSEEGNILNINKKIAKVMFKESSNSDSNSDEEKDSPFGFYETDKFRFIFTKLPNKTLLSLTSHKNIILNIQFAYLLHILNHILEIIANSSYKPNFLLKNLTIERLLTKEKDLSVFYGKKINFENNYIQILNVSYREPVYKFVILGDPEVGKTSLISKYTSGKFRDEYIATIGVSITNHAFKIPLEPTSGIKLLLWDLAGQEKFKFARKIYLEGARGCFLVYSVIDRNSFNNINKWYKYIKEDLGKIPTFLVANKIDLDLQRIIPPKEGIKKAEDLKCSYIETSAKTGENVKEAFEMLGLILFLLQ
ncbi:MAG: Rab family GTPase [Promethearchaeota archaeon]